MRQFLIYLGLMGTAALAICVFFFVCMVTSNMWGGHGPDYRDYIGALIAAGVTAAIGVLLTMIGALLTKPKNPPSDKPD